MQNKRFSRGGFALPTVLIASVVMLTILAVSVSSVASVRTTLKTQYYEQLAKAAGEAGVAYAKACLAKNGNVPLWTASKPLKPSTDCSGNSLIENGSFNSIVVAGGGSGGGSTGGGGGGGGVVETKSFVLNTGSYPVAVGAGGAIPGGQAQGRDGANSSFNGIIAAGGGGGAHTATGGILSQGRNGGSGGGGQVYYSTSNPGSGSAGQGNAGGPISGIGSQSTTGGGGAGGVGQTTPIRLGGGNGGLGVLSTISGNASYYGGGGGGGVDLSAAGTSVSLGNGGGGNGGTVGTNGQANTGGGGGGGWAYSGGNGGAGGSGVVYVAYPNNAGIVATGGNSIYVSGAYKIHRFTSNGTFSLTAVSPSSCPTDPRCSVMVNDNLRSSFSIGAITVDTTGRAISIPNTGFVELLRESTGEVWRTYRQPSVQAAIAPDLCSGAASSGLGWSNAVPTATQEAIPSASSAQTISIVDNSLSSGKMYFRKDFTVTESGSYNLALLTSASNSAANAYVNGSYISNSRGGLTNTPVNLSVGCHTVTVELTNKTFLPQASRFTAAIQKDSANPIVATDSSWRVSSGSSVHFSDADYAVDSEIWSPVTDLEEINVAGWNGTTGDAFTRLIAAECTTLCPPSSTTYFRNSREFVITQNTEVLVSMLCDDDCSVYVDGDLIVESSPWPSNNQQTLTLTPGVHQVGVRVYNSGVNPNPAKFAMVIYDKSAGEVLVRSDAHWLTASNVWVPGENKTNDPTSYEESFRPSPLEIPEQVTADVLVVGGGAGAASNAAGGGGGGGVQYFDNLPMTTGSKAITVGGGGLGGASSTGTPGAGGISQFWNTSYRAMGGGGGAPRSSSLILPGNGATGGGGAGSYTTANDQGGTGTFGQGGNGGNGTPIDAVCGARGGGGGGAGGGGTSGVANSVSGNGGPGYITFITGQRLGVAGGGGGSSTCSVVIGATTDGAAAGSNGASAAANTGGGGTANAGGANGGNGGSGLVIIRVKTGSMTVATTGNPVVSNVTIGGVPYTIYRYNASGTFNPTSLTP